MDAGWWSCPLGQCLCVIRSQCPLSVFRWLPESARWLLANGRREDARKYLVQCAKMNGKHEYASRLDSEVKPADPP